MTLEDVHMHGAWYIHYSEWDISRDAVHLVIHKYCKKLYTMLTSYCESYIRQDLNKWIFLQDIIVGEDERQNLIKHYKYIRSYRAGSGAISVWNKCRTIIGTYYCCLIRVLQSIRVNTDTSIQMILQGPVKIIRWLYKWDKSKGYSRESAYAKYQVHHIGYRDIMIDCRWLKPGIWVQ